MATLSKNFSNSANGWDVTIYWSCEYGASSAYMWWEVNQNSYGRTFQVVERGNTGNRYNSGSTLTVGKEYLLYVYKNGAYSQQAGPFTITAPDPPRYTVSYNANGGSGAPGSQTKIHGQSLTLSGTRPTRTGYSFVRWDTSSSGNGTPYSPGAVFTGNYSLTLYAIWKADTYTVRFDANGGSGGPGTQTKTYGQTLTLSSATPTRTGYAFVSWNTAKNGSGATYHPGGQYTNNAALTLYAIWKANGYSVIFDANGGSGAPGNQTKVHDQTLTLSSTRPSRTGYIFAHWSTSKSGGGTIYQPGGQYTGNAALSLYAVWTPITYFIEFRSNGGEGEMGRQQMTYDVRARLQSNQFRRAGHTFAGWGTSESSGAKYSNNEEVGNLSTANNATVVLFAQWTINPITITFDAATNGGSTSVPSKVINYGAVVPELPTATKPYYKFIGWFTQPSGGTQVTSQTQFFADTTIYAQFAIDSSCSVKVGGAWRKGIPYVKVGGEWRKGYALVKTNGTWQQGIG